MNTLYGQKTIGLVRRWIHMSLVALMVCAAPLTAGAATFGTYTPDTPGQFPDVAFLHRPYYVQFKSNRDGATDWFSLFLPSDFDPNKIYPVWFKFKPYYGSGSNANGPSHAWNYCDSNQVIVIGCNLRGTGDAWFGDNQNMDPVLASNIVADTIEILNQLMSMYKISYVAASGASMGGYSSLKFLSKLPQSYVGAVVSSCPAIWFRPWVQTGSDLLYNQVSSGFFNDKFVMLLHGTGDDTVPVQYSRDLTAAAPNKTWWQLVEIPGGGHADYFVKFDYVNYSYPFDEQYGQCPTVPNLWQQIHNWEAAHPSIATTYRTPLPGWTTPTNWYFPQTIYDARPAKGGATNTAPGVNAGADQTITLPAAATLSGTVTDDGLPSNSVTVAWSKVSGPGTVTFTNTTTLNTRATFSTSGAYVIRLVAYDGALSATDTLAITVNAAAANAAPAVNAGSDQSITLPSTAALSGAATDDGLPSNKLTVAWSKVSGPGTVSFANATSLVTSAGFSTNGAYVLRLTASDTALAASDDIAVTVNPVPPAPTGVVTARLQKGVSPGTNFVGCKDSTFRSISGATFGTHALGKDAALDLRWRDAEGTGIVWFDLSSIPAGAVIQGATLKLWHEPSEFESTSGSVLMYPLHDPNGTGMWDENAGAVDTDYGVVATAGCALFKRPGVAWASTGEGRYSEVVTLSEELRFTHTAGVTGWLSFAVTRDVKNYATNAAQNLGWIFYSEIDGTIRGQLHTADSSAPAKRPVLEVVYGSATTNQAPVVSAGSNQTITLPSTAVLSGTATDDGLPAGSLSFAWSKLSGPGTVTFTNAATANTRASFSTNGSYVLQLIANDTALSRTATVTVTVNAAPVNQAPVVSAGSNQTITLPSTVALSGTATDDGLPSNKLTVAWSKVSGAGTVTFGNATSLVTTASFSTNGSYVLRLVASDTALARTGTVTITVNAAPVNQAPVVSAGSNQTITLPSVANLAGTATDDGLPSNKLTVVWSKVSGAGTVTFGSATSLATTASFSTNGAYVLRLIASDTALARTGTVTITVNAAPVVNQAPVVSAGSNQTITLPSTVTLSGTATDDGLPSNKLTVVWSKMVGPGTVTFGNATSLVTTASFSTNGSYALQLVATDTALARTGTVTITVNAAPVNQAPVVNAGSNQTISLPSVANLSGTATDDGLPSNKLTVVWSKMVGPGTVTFGTATSLVTTASFSTNGSYVLRLVASDTALARTGTVTITVNAAPAPGGVVTARFQKGVSPAASYAGSKDSTLRSLTGASFGLHSLGKDVAVDPRWRDAEGAGLVWFDVSTIPAGATIQSATLKFWHEPSEFEDTAGSLVLYPLRDPNGTGLWDENTNAVYNDYGSGAVAGCALFKRPGVAWASTGEGRYTEVIQAAEGVTSLVHSAGVTGWISVAVTRDVSRFATNAAQNLGWIFHAVADSTIRGQLHTADSTAAKRPTLEVVYSTGGAPVNQAPTASAGADQAITLPSTVVLNGSATDDGLPSNKLNYAWSKVSGPGTVTFTNAATANTRAGFGSNGVYVLRLTVSDTALTASDDIQVTVNSSAPANQAPTVNAGTDQAITLPSTATLGGAAVDDGLPSGTLTFVWSKVSGPGTVTFTNTTTLTTRASFSTNGAYVLRLTASDTALSASDDLAITVNAAASGGSTNARVIPPLSDLIAASQYLNPGDIPDDAFAPPANALYVAATGGSDANAGTLAAPFATLDRAINFANASPATPYTIHLRGGTHTFKGVDPFVTINRGNLYIKPYNGEAVTLRPPFWPGNPYDWSSLRCFIAYGPHTNITVDGVTIEGWQIAFEVGGASGTGPAMRNLTLKNIVARNFTHRDGYAGNIRHFLSTSYLSDDVYGAGKEILTNPVTAHYQLENVILSNIEVRDTDMAINVGDENDANIKGIRISNFNILNPPSGSGSSANDGMAIVNCYKVLIDSCTISNTIDDGIDTKAFDVAVINTYVEGTGRNGVKFWRSGELINSFVYACTVINDGAFVSKEGPCRVINSVLMSKYNGYAAHLGYGVDPAIVGSLEIVNSIFVDNDGPFYVVHNNMTSKNSLYYDMRGGFFQGGVGNINDVGTLNSRAGSSGNITAHPLLTNVGNRNFAPQAGSPCIDAGTTGALIPVFDFFGRPRVNGALPDIGPIEY